CCRRKFWLNPRDCGIDVLERLEHIHVPVKEKIDFCRPATGCRPYFLEAGHAVHRFFDGTCHCDHHLVNRHYTVVDGKNNARKIGGGENCNRDVECKKSAQRRQCEDQKDQRL